MKNPESSLYHDRVDGDQFYSSDKLCEQTRRMLGNLAGLSENGLYLFILYYDAHIPLEERLDFYEKNIFYHATNDWDSVPYIFPEGNVVEKEVGRVFHIQPAAHAQS